MVLRSRKTNTDPIRHGAEQGVRDGDGQTFDYCGNVIDRSVYSIYQLAERFGVKPATILNWQSSGKLPEGFIRKGRRFWTVKEITKWEEGQR